MEVDLAGTTGSDGSRRQVRVRRRTVESVLEECQRALQMLRNTDLNLESAVHEPAMEEEIEGDEGPTPTSLTDVDCEAYELCDLLKSKVESPDFLEKLSGNQNPVSCSNSGDENASWDMITSVDLWEDKHINGDIESDKDGYILVSQEDIVEGIACFMAAYLASLKETKELTPSQLQQALSKTFSIKKKKSKLRKAWDGTKVIYNVASWGATAIGIYQNPALLGAASAAFWTSCRVISKLL
ncbi:uncharacterized protein [Typha angustifolia]|uniref:uncharacterized protein n=1 Tax=Typha angustifolia TaxID=59011 RepID=UPI003C2BB70D